MAHADNSNYSTKGTYFVIDGVHLPQVTSISDLGAGSANEIDVTSLTSRAREYAIGFADEGNVNAEGVAPLQNPLMTTLDAAKRDGRELSCQVYVGGVPNNSVDGATDGSGQTVNSGLEVATSVVSSKRVYTTTKDANELKSVHVGDYVKDGTSYVKITKLVVTGDKLVITTDGTTNTSATSVDTVKPGVKFAFIARASSFGHGMTVDEVVRYTLSLRITGAITRTLGNPNVTIT